MSPIRLIIIGILLYIGYLLIKGGSKKKSVGTEKKDSPSELSDVLVECPVCQKLVPRQQAEVLEHEGETIYFCGDECRKEFVSDKGAE